MSDQNSQIIRIQSINKKANDWKDEGFEVKANIGGWDRPPQVEGLIPILRGKRGDSIRIGWVCFEDEIEADRSSWEKLSNYAEQNKNTSFRLYSISENGDCKLYKIFK